MTKSLTLKITYSATCLALCMVLPLLTGQIPQIGSMLSPMHIPVLLCGFLCGWQWGLSIGFVAPLLRSLIFGMPPIFPTATAMAFELATYGVASGLLYKFLPKKIPFIYLALIISMLLGRGIWGLASLICYSVASSSFTLTIFLTWGFVNAVPGIICQILLIPPVVIALRKANLMPSDIDDSAKDESA